MSNFEFIDYIPTADAKNQIGIVTVKLNGSIPQILRFKIVQRKDGHGFFYAPPSVKVNRYGVDEYLAAQMFDSRSIDEELKNFIHLHVSKILNGTSVHAQQKSVEPSNTPPPSWMGTSTANDDEIPF